MTNEEAALILDGWTSQEEIRRLRNEYGEEKAKEMVYCAADMGAAALRYTVSWIPYHDGDDVPEGKWLVQCEDGELYCGTMTEFGWMFGHWVPKIVAYTEMLALWKGEL